MDGSEGRSSCGFEMDLGLERGYNRVQPKALRDLRCSRAPAVMLRTHKERAVSSARKASRNQHGGQATAAAADPRLLAMVPPRLPTVLQRPCFIRYPNTATPAPRHSNPFPFLGHKVKSCLCPNLPRPLPPSSGPDCPFVLQSKTTESATATGNCASCKEKSLPPGASCMLGGGSFPFAPKTRSGQTPRRACPRIDWPGRAQNLWPPLVKSSNVNRGMSRLAQSHQAPTGAINLYNMWKEECTSQQVSGAGGGVTGKGGSCFFALFFFFW